jgi:AcrR family transcriptional regulator
MTPVAVVDQARPTSLRERNKARTRAELEEAAVALFASRGFDRVTVDDIAAASGVSRRTFFRYFDSKEDVLLADQAQRLVDLRAAFVDRPPDEPLVAAVRKALLVIADAYEDERPTMFVKIRLIFSTPSVMARNLERQVAWENTLAELIAERLGVDVATSLEARVLGTSAIAAVRAAVGVWLDSGGAANLHDVCAEALDILLDGRRPLG